MGLQVDQNRAITMASAPGPLIDANDLECRCGWDWRLMNNPQQRGWRCDALQALGETRPGLSTQSNTHVQQGLCQPESAPCPGLSRVGQTFGENAAMTGLIATEELVHLYV